MPLGLTTEQHDLADAVTAWTRSVSEVSAASRLAAETDPGVVHAEVWKGAAGMGLFSIAVPERLGGDGGTVVDAATALERCASALVPGPLLPTVVVGAVLARADRLTDVLAAALRRVSTGDLVCAMALRAVDGTADADGAVHVHGEVPAVLGAPGADVVLLPILVDGSVSTRWCLLDLADEAPTVVALTSHDATRRVGALHIDAQVPADRIVDIGARVPWDIAVTMAAAEAAGVADWCTTTASEYAARRVQFGRPVGSFQAIKHLCAQMLCLREQSVALAWDAARACDGDGAAVAAAAAVVFDNAVRTAKDCIQVLGGIGFTWEHDAHRYLRRATASRQLFGLVAPFGDGSSWTRICADMAARATEPTGPVERAVHVGVDDTVLDRARLGIADVLRVSPPERRPALAKAGLMMPAWPVPYGLGADAATALAVDEELVTAGLDRPELGIAAWALPTIIVHGDDAQRDRFVPPTLRGELEWCQLFSEPEAGSDLASLRTTATRVDGGWALNGQKVWTSNAHTAHWAVCLARTGAAGSRGITYFLVDMASAGLTVRPLREMTGDALFNEVFLDDVFVSDACVVGEVDGGWVLTRTTLANERVSMGNSRAMGVDAGRVVEAWATSDLGGDAVAADRVGRLVAVGTSVSLLGLRSQLRRVHGHGPGAESSVQKLLGVEHRQDAADLGLDLLGPAGIGASPDASTQMHDYLLTRCLSIAGGSTQILRTVVGEQLLGLPREPSVRATHSSS